MDILGHSDYFSKIGTFQIINVRNGTVPGTFIFLQESDFVFEKKYHRRIMRRLELH